jgi:hypothetical protein
MAALDLASDLPSSVSDSSRPRDREDGVALILVLIFTVLLYAMIADLVTSARTARLTGEGDALLDRMRNHQDFVMVEVENMLYEDLAAASGAGDVPEGGDGAGAPISAALDGGAAAGAEGEDVAEEEDPAAIADGSQDTWFEPTSYAEDDITTYVWVEDENRKFNVLSLVSADEEFAELSVRRFARIVDWMREGTEFDLSEADGEAIAEALQEWMRGGGRTEWLPRPPLKTDTEDERREISLMLHLDEMLLLRNVDEDLMYDRVLDGRVIPGLESVFTCYTSVGWDPGDPEDIEREQQQNGGAGANSDPNAGGLSGLGAAAGGGVGGGPDQPPAGAAGASSVGLGIRVNINTAPPAVLYGLAGEAIPEPAIEAILRWRNEEVEEDEQLSDTLQNYVGDVDEGQSPRRRVFTDLEQLDDIDEWQNIADETAKSEFVGMLSTTSDVFSVHMASLFRKNEEQRTFVVRRSRAVLVRLDNGEDGYLHPLIPRQERTALRVFAVDFPDDVGNRFLQFDDMDPFAREERSWNPFYVEFFLPADERERLFGY